MTSRPRLTLEQGPEWQLVQWVLPTLPNPHYDIPSEIEPGQK